MMCSGCSVSSGVPTSLHPLDCSPPGSSVPGILQARTLEWAAISSSILDDEACPISSAHTHTHTHTLTYTLIRSCFLYFFSFSKSSPNPETTPTMKSSSFKQGSTYRGDTACQSPSHRRLSARWQHQRSRRAQSSLLAQEGPPTPSPFPQVLTDHQPGSPRFSGDTLHWKPSAHPPERGSSNSFFSQHRFFHQVVCILLQTHCAFSSLQNQTQWNPSHLSSSGYKPHWSSFTVKHLRRGPCSLKFLLIFPKLTPLKPPLPPTPWNCSPSDEGQPPDLIVNGFDSKDRSSSQKYLPVSASRTLCLFGKWEFHLLELLEPTNQPKATSTRATAKPLPPLPRPSTKTSHRLQPRRTSRTSHPANRPLPALAQHPQPKTVCSAQSLPPAGAQWSSPGPAHQETPRPPALHKNPVLTSSASARCLGSSGLCPTPEHVWGALPGALALSTEQPREGPAWPPSGSDNGDGPHHQAPATSQGCHLQRPHPRLLTKHLSHIPAPLFISLLISWKAKLHNRECDPCLEFGVFFFFFW